MTLPPKVARNEGVGRRWLGAVLAFAAVAILAAPLAAQALRVGAAEAQAGRPFAGALPTLWELLQAYTLRRVAWPAAAQAALAAVALALLALGIAAAPRRGSLGLALWLVVPLLAGNAILALDATVFAEQRYFLFLIPALCLAWGSGLSWLSRRVPALGWSLAAGWIAVAVLALPALWTPANLREDWRAAAAYVEAHAEPGDAVLVHPAFVHVAFETYAGGDTPIFYPFDGEVDDRAQIEGPLRGLVEYDTVWLVTSHDAQPDPQGLVARWFDEQYPLVTEQYPTGIVVRGYATRSAFEALPPGATPADIAYVGGLKLVGYRVDETTVRARDERYHPPSQWIHATLYLSFDGPPAGDLALSLQLIDSLGQVWGDRLSRAGELLRQLPASQWEPKLLYRNDLDVNLNPATPPGAYRLELQILDAAGRPWSRADGAARMELAPVIIIE